MIIHKEQIDITLPNGQPGKKLIVSYVNDKGKIGFLNYTIPPEQMFEWKYTKPKYADPPFMVIDKDGKQKQVQWKSYDDKPVARKPCKVLPENRLNELLCSFGSYIDPLFVMNVPDTWFCDIEVDVVDDFPEPEEARTPINTIAMSKFPDVIVWSRKDLSEREKNWIQDQIENYSQDPDLCTDETKRDITKGYKFQFRYFPDERSMLDNFLDFSKDVAAIAGWNFLNFDMLYIRNRCLQNNLDFEKLSPTHNTTTFRITPRSGGATINLKLPLHKLIYDYLLVFKTWDQTVEHCENYKLDYIAKRVLGIGKKAHSWGFKDGYRDFFADYVFYQCIDSIILEQIDKELNTAKIWFMLASILRINAYDAFSTINPVETVISNFIYEDYKVIPSMKHEVPEVQESYAGAWVLPVNKSIVRYIGGLDFASLYPSIIRQFGVSPEKFLFKDTKVIGKNPDGTDKTVVGDYVPKEDEIKMKSGAVYKKGPAILPNILTHYYNLRKQAKNDRKDVDTELAFYEKILEEREAGANLSS